jgi:drug/metabolite transporter (DMT)-like permease
MNMLNERQLQVHIPIVAWLLIVTNGLVAVLGLFIMVVTMTAPAQFLARALAFPALMFVLTIPGLVAGFGLRERKPWARVLGFLGAVLNGAGPAYAYTLGNTTLSMVVVGAVFSLYAIFVLAQNSVTATRHA